MTVTINGTTGIAGVDGSAGTPAVQGSDTNTGVFFPAADTVAIATGGSERVRVNSVGDTGFGTSSVTAASGYTTVAVNNTTGGRVELYANGVRSGSFLSSSSSTQIGTISATPLIFNVETNEAARFDTSRNLLVGGTGVIYYSKILSQFDGATKYGFVANDTSNTSNAGFAGFTVNGTSTTGAIGSITRNGSTNAVLFNTTSDVRLKENIADADDALSLVSAIKVRKYDWKDGGQHEKHGFIAQELAEVVDNVVSKGRAEEDMWALDYGKLTPLLCKAIQEQQALIESLTARIAALEGAA